MCRPHQHVSAATPSGGKVKAGPKAYTEKRRKTPCDEARDILAHVVLCHVLVHRYNFQNKLL